MPCQQDELYAAEAIIPAGRGFASVVEAQAWTAGLVDSTYFQNAYPNVSWVELRRIKHGPGNVAPIWVPEQEGGIIGLYPEWFHEQPIVHELAHICAHARYGRPVGHAPWFAELYLQLTYAARGSDIYVQLRDSFVRHGIDFQTDSYPTSGISL